MSAIAAAAGFCTGDGTGDVSYSSSEDAVGRCGREGAFGSAGGGGGAAAAAPSWDAISWMSSM